MCGNTEIVVVIRGWVRTCYLCFTQTPVFTDSLVLEDSERTNERSVSDRRYISYLSYYMKVPKLHANSLTLPSIAVRPLF